MTNSDANRTQAVSNIALAVPVSGLPAAQRRRPEMFQLASRQAFSFS